MFYNNNNSNKTAVSKQETLRWRLCQQARGLQATQLFILSVRQVALLA